MLRICLESSTGDIIEGKHGREEMQSSLFMYLLSVRK